MSKDLVSVVIPAFNRMDYIRQAVDSVLEQSYPHIELIAVDDGSSDGTYGLLQEFERDGKLRLITHEGHINKGQSAALNLGISAATGAYIAILDSDDMFAPGKLVDQVAFLEAHPDIGMVYGQGHAVDADGHFLFKVPGDGHEESSDPNRILLDCYMALPGGALVRRSVMDKAGGFEEDFRASQDHDMVVRVMEVTRVAYLPRLAFFYRKHGDAISVNSLERRWLTGMEILRRAAARYPYRKSTLRKRKAVLHFRLGQTYWRQGKRLKAIPHLLKSGLLDPMRAVGVLTGREQV